MKILDLFCGAGGAAMGYHKAGFEVTGVDIKLQPKYPFRFIQFDAMELEINYLKQFDIVHASPPCQKFSTITKTAKTENKHHNYITIVRNILIASEIPYVIENVPSAPLINPLILCGTMFGLNIIRHRAFETNPQLWFSPTMCCHNKKVVKHGRKPDRKIHYAAATGHFSDVAFVQESMEIDWQGQKELAQTIPPAYTEFIGKQLLDRIVG